MSLRAILVTTLGLSLLFAPDISSADICELGDNVRIRVIQDSNSSASRELIRLRYITLPRGVTNEAFNAQEGTALGGQWEALMSTQVLASNVPYWKDGLLSANLRTYNAAITMFYAGVATSAVGVVQYASRGARLVPFLAGFFAGQGFSEYRLAQSIIQSFEWFQDALRQGSAEAPFQCAVSPEAETGTMRTQAALLELALPYVR